MFHTLVLALTSFRRSWAAPCGCHRLLLHHPGLQAPLPELLHLLCSEDVAALELQVAQLLLDERHLVLAQRLVAVGCALSSVLCLLGFLSAPPLGVSLILMPDLQQLLVALALLLCQARHHHGQRVVVVVVQLQVRGQVLAVVASLGSLQCCWISL